MLYESPPCTNKDDCYEENSPLKSEISSKNIFSRALGLVKFLNVGHLQMSDVEENSPSCNMFPFNLNKVIIDGVKEEREGFKEHQNCH